jgi:hypothetical protein
MRLCCVHFGRRHLHTIGMGHHQYMQRTRSLELWLLDVSTHVHRGGRLVKKRSCMIPCDEGVLGNMVCECSPFVLRLPPIPKIWAKWRSCLLSIPGRYRMDRVDSNDGSVAPQHATIVMPHNGFCPRMTCCEGR